MDRDKTIVNNVLEMEKSLRVPVKITYDEVDRLVVERLIRIRSSRANRNKDISYIDKTILFFLTEEEFEKYVINEEEIEY